MALSGTTSFTLTARQVIDDALKLIGVTGLTETPKAADVNNAKLRLEQMLKHWQTAGPNLWKKNEGNLSLEQGQTSYVLASTLRISSVRFDNGTTETPMFEMSREEYFDQPNKGAEGTPTQYYFDPQRTEGRLYVWPTPSTSTNSTVNYSYQSRIDDIGAIDNDIDIPQEWLMTLSYNLAAVLTESYGIEGEIANRVIGRAEKLLQEAKDFDREDILRFEIGHRYGRA